MNGWSIFAYRHTKSHEHLIGRNKSEISVIRLWIDFILVLAFFSFCYTLTHTHTHTHSLSLSLSLSLVPIIWSNRIHRLSLCWGVVRPPNECPRYDTKQSDDEAPVMLELWGMQSTPSLPSLPGPLCSRVVAAVRVPVMGKIEVFDIKQSTHAKLNCLK